MSTSATTKEFSLLNHKPALFVLFFTEMWERFSYYGMRAIFVLFLTASFSDGGWEWTRERALGLLGIYTSSVYITPLIGGIIADKLLSLVISISSKSGCILNFEINNELVL